MRAPDVFHFLGSKSATAKIELGNAGVGVIIKANDYPINIVSFRFACVWIGDSGF